MKGLAEVGPWAKEKLQALERYLEFYTKILKNQRWQTIYVDAFAGGGRAVVRSDPKRAMPSAPLFLGESEVDSDQRELIDGSPRVALDIANPFARYVFIDPDPARITELLALRDEYAAGRSIDVLAMDAAAGIDWVASQAISRSTHRGVVFLDPFGANLTWSSIQRLADTKLFEVVINFGLNMTIQRMLPNSGRISEAWTAKLDAYFGTHEWFDAAYRERSGGLFETNGLEKHSDYSERLIELYRKRLKEAFGHVSTARLIRNTRGVPLYHLVWAGPHRKGLEGADYILRMGERVGRQTVTHKTS